MTAQSPTGCVPHSQTHPYTQQGLKTRNPFLLITTAYVSTAGGYRNHTPDLRAPVCDIPLDVGQHSVEGASCVQVAPRHEVTEAAIVVQRDVAPCDAWREEVPRLDTQPGRPSGEH